MWESKSVGNCRTCFQVKLLDEHSFCESCVDTLKKLPGLLLEIKDGQATALPQSQAEEAAYVICGDDSQFDDDIWTTCSKCGRKICHRPFVPSKPPKICFGCLLKLDRNDES
jgi:hypothetical protein